MTSRERAHLGGVCTTNALLSVNARIRKDVKVTRGHFPYASRPSATSPTSEPALVSESFSWDLSCFR